MMAALGPFEAVPHLAVGVSGGADSMALCLLAHDWVQRGGGTITALIVDHGLRSGSSAEAAQVQRWLTARGIQNRVLSWTGAKPNSAIQERARTARRHLMLDWCRKNAVMHLLLAHHRDDQAETVLMRRARKCDGPGMAGMAAASETAEARILRPLLGISRERIEATLRARGQDWVDDPSNDDLRFERVRVRRSLRANDVGEAGRMAAETAEAGRVRAKRERETAHNLAARVRFEPLGYAYVDLRRELPAPMEPVLSSLLATVGGGAYPPSGERLAAVAAWLALGAPGGGRTLAGCRLIPLASGKLLVCREAGRITAQAELVPGRSVEWDRRFRIALPSDAPVGVRAGAPHGPMPSDPRIRAIPGPVRAGLPALYYGGEMIGLPALGWSAPDAPAWAAESIARFQPARPLTAAQFFPVPCLAATAESIV